MNTNTPHLTIGLSLLIFILLIVLPQMESIKCWNCNSASDPKCKDPFDNTSLPIVDCDIKKLDRRPGLKATMCRKIRQKVNGIWRFHRACAFLGVPGEGHGDENYCLMRTGTYNIFIETCTCNSKDGCNSANLEFPNSGLIFWLALPLLIMWNILKI